MITLLGLLFTFLWSTSAIAIKFGLVSTTPLFLAAVRVVLAGALLFVYLYVIKKKSPWPNGREWRSLLILGFLNTTLYLGSIFWALSDVSAGLFNLFVTVNPFFVAALSFVLLNRKVSGKEWAGMIVAGIGLMIAAGPELVQAEAKMSGIIVIGVGMVSMAIGSIYFKKTDLPLPSSVINTWQLCIGGTLLVPFAFGLEREQFFLIADVHFLGALSWLVFVTSIGTMVLWFYLLKKDAVKANNWLFLTPVFGYSLAALLLNETVLIYDMVATVFVVSGLLLSGNIPMPFMKKNQKKGESHQLKEMSGKG